MTQPKPSIHGIPTALVQPRLEPFARSVVFLSVLGVADGDVVPLGAED